MYAILAVSKIDFELNREGVANWLLSISDWAIELLSYWTIKPLGPNVPVSIARGSWSNKKFSQKKCFCSVESNPRARAISDKCVKV